MYELTLSASLSNSLMIEHIKSHIKNQIEENSGIIVSMLHMGKAMLTIAVPKNIENVVKDKIISLVAQEIISSYKREIFNDLISSSTMTEESLNIIKYLVYSYENSIDEEIIKKNILLEDFLDIDSVYYFKLGESRKRWTSSALTVKNNLSQLLCFYDFPSLCKFLLEGKQSTCDNIHIMVKNDEVVIVGHQKNIIKSIKIDSQKLYFSLFTSLIDIMPNHIYTTRNILNICPKFSIIQLVFDGAVYYTE